MEVVELLLYIILVLVLLSLIGIMGWLLYDYNNLKDKLTGNFQNISNTFSSHKTKDNTLEDNINSNSSNILNTSNYVLDVKTNLSSDLTESASNTSNYIGIVEEKAVGIDSNLSTFHNNLNKYFTFGTSGEDINGSENKLYNYIFDSDLTVKDKRLELMYETTIASDMTVNGVVNANSNVILKTDSEKNLKICSANSERDINKCINIYNDGSNLIIKNPNDNGKIIIGDGTEENSLVIDSSNLKFKKKDVFHEGTPTEYITSFFDT
jgi:predicted Holliday junction resolvase-like endonuclease